MSFQPGSQLHYSCNFLVSPRYPRNTAWSDLIKEVRSWVKFATKTDDGLLGKWFFKGGRWLNPPCDRMHVQVEQEAGDSCVDSPEYWVLRYEHPCKDIPFRRWRTDVGVTTCSGKFQFTV